MCHIRNGCSIPIDRVRICIKQYIKLNSYSAVYNRNRKVGEKSYDGIGPREETEGHTRFLDISLAELKSEVNHQVFSDFTPIYNEEMALANCIQPTTSGLHVNITYKLEIKLMYNTYCATLPQTSIPLFIQAPALQDFTMIQAPEGWNPTTYDEANFALPVPPTEMAQVAPMEDPGYNTGGMGLPGPGPMNPGGMGMQGQAPGGMGMPGQAQNYGGGQMQYNQGYAPQTQNPAGNIPPPSQIPAQPSGFSQQQVQPEHQPLMGPQNQP